MLIKLSFIIALASVQTLPTQTLPTQTTAIDDQPWHDSEMADGTELVPRSAELAAEEIEVPEGFRVNLFASEPQVRNPISMSWDDRGRLWVAENGTYAERGVQFDLTLRDRIRIFHDSDHDGVAESSTLFANNLSRLTSIEVDHDGVWALCPPHLYFLPDRDHNDQIDGEPETILVGFEVPTENYHTIANGLKFGPDGWLYGRCGASSPGQVRPADQPASTAVPIAGGIWRFHPTTQVFEVLCHGTTNPWGHDWNETGEGFFINTVNGHLWHMIPGAHFQRPHSVSPNPLVYQALAMHADHYHWDTREDWTASRGGQGTHDAAGGGHAHCGVSIYLGGHWPEKYNGRLLTLNLHGRRINVERLERHGSGFIGRHDPDLFRVPDPWFRGLDLQYGPDGNLTVLDWSDTGECHEHTGVHRNSGRIYRLSYTLTPSLAPPTGFDSNQGLRAMTEVQLLDTLEHSNQWWVRQARRELTYRAAQSQLWIDGVAASLLCGFEHKDPIVQANHLLTLGAIASAASSETAEAWRVFDRQGIERALRHTDERLRVIAVRRSYDAFPIDTVLGESRVENQTLDPMLLKTWEQLALNDPSPWVRLAVASGLQRIPAEHRLPIALALARHADDATDANLPGLVWFGLIPVARKAPAELAKNIDEITWPTLRQNIARRCGELAGDSPELLELLFNATLDAPITTQHDVLLGLAAGMQGLRQVAAPKVWSKFRLAYLEQTQVNDQQRQALDLVDSVFGDGQSLDRLRELVTNNQADLATREAALRTLMDLAPDDLRRICTQALRVRYLNRTALTGLTRFDDPEIAQQLVADYRAFHPQDRPAVIATLVSRPEFTASLLDGIAQQKIPRSDLRPDQARALLDRGDALIAERLREVWGELRDSDAQRQARFDELKSLLTAELAAENVASATTETMESLGRGRTLYSQRCANCHRLFGQGNDLGPDLTGSDRRNLDYLLSNLVDPSAVVPRDAQLTFVEMNDGRSVAGVVVGESEATLTLQTADSRETLLKAEFTERELLDRSLMPDGLLDDLSPEMIRDLIAYLQSETQVPLVELPESENER